MSVMLLSKVCLMAFLTIFLFPHIYSCCTSTCTSYLIIIHDYMILIVSVMQTRPLLCVQKKLCVGVVFLLELRTMSSMYRAAISNDVDWVRELLKRGRYDVNCTNEVGVTPLHLACFFGHVDMIRMLILEFQADTTLQDYRGDTPLHVAACEGDEELILTLITELGCDVNTRNSSGESMLHVACKERRLGLAKTLFTHYNADINAQDEQKNTPLHLAANMWKEDNLLKLVAEAGCCTNSKGYLGRTLLHIAFERGFLTLAKDLIKKYNADVSAQDELNNTPLHLAAKTWQEDDTIKIIKIGGCNANIKGCLGKTLLHIACERGFLTLAKDLITKYNADVSAQDEFKDTPLHLAAKTEKEDDTIKIIKIGGCNANTKGCLGKTLLHIAFERGFFTLAKDLIKKYNADVSAQDELNNTPLHLAAKTWQEDDTIKIIKIGGCNANIKGCLGKTLLHIACERGFLTLAKDLITKYNADVSAQDELKDTPLHLATKTEKEDGAIKLITLAECDANIKGFLGKTLLHIACERGFLILARYLIQKCDANVNAQDELKDTPLHLAAKEGKVDIAVALIEEFNCSTDYRNIYGDHFLHSACQQLTWNANIVKRVGKHASLLATNDDGDTPLHLAAERVSSDYVEALLLLDPPIMLRNAAGKTARDVAKSGPKQVLDAYFVQNQAKIYVHYDIIMQQAKKRYSSAERITRIIAVGNPEAGKSSFIETMKREGFFESFRRVTESSVPPHTAGIVPSIYTSKHYGRVLFYDFAGDPEYYSSHAAILENLASLNIGDNIFSH